MKLVTHNLCANTQKNGTDFRNFDFKLFFLILNLDLVSETA